MILVNARCFAGAENGGEATFREIIVEMKPRNHHRYETFIRLAAALPPLRTAVVHPCFPEALQSALELIELRLLDPKLVSPVRKIGAAARTGGLALGNVPIKQKKHSHTAAALSRKLAVRGRVAGLMKGSRHTVELLGAVVGARRLRTTRRMSHAYVTDIPAYEKLLVLTDAAVNIAPGLDQKRDICKNAIDLMHLLAVRKTLVAMLAAVEAVRSNMPATVDAGARGQIQDGVADGPLAFDNAVSMDAAKAKQISSRVSGAADVLLSPDLEAGNMLAKQLIYFADADAAGLVLGARAPVILTSRADLPKVRMASTALGRLLAASCHSRHLNPTGAV